MTADAPDTLAVARGHLARWAWDEAFDAARSAGVAPGRAEADRLDMVAEAAWWLGRLDECIDAREQAYARYEAVGDRLRAGQCAVWLWEHHQMKARPAIAGAWLRRARHALEADTESIEFGNLVLREAELAHGSGDLDGATTLARDALRLGQELPSADLEAEALQTIGRVLIDAGRAADGLAHLDEAMLSAVEGRLGPYTTGKVYCSLISACEELGDLRRAAEWTDATLRWSSENHPLAMWPGICRVHHAALLQLRGDWGAAEREARQACVELDGFHVPNVAAGYIEIGEIRRRLGDLHGAEEAFARAEELCGQQSAGLALVRLAQRRVDEATAIITRMLAEHTSNQLARGKLLPARVQIAIAARDLDTATAAASELERIATDNESPVLSAAALSSRGRLQLAQGDTSAACATLRQAVQRWQQLEVPYEVATARLLLGQACRDGGDEDGATRSLASAAAIFDRLGASLDAGHIRDLTSPSSLPAGLTAREAEVLSLVASGQTNKEIAATLHRSERTVARHLSNIFTKVGVTSRTAAAGFAYENGLAQPSPAAE
ncbi:MAG TPA: LuxR C-terminal-related transcriptional regulator [Acidimicrobiales bacterium]